jgi:acetylornithine deacetylase/succinyl-diaminopimelate desuccinylase-like protein
MGLDINLVQIAMNLRSFLSSATLHRTCAGLSFTLLSGACGAQHVLTTAQAEQAAQHSFPEYLHFLSLPSDAARPADIQRNAAWLQAAFQARGLQTRLLPNEGKPLVYAELPAAQPDARTVLFYMHFDAQPVTASEWQTDPWTPTLRTRDATGQWQTLPISRLSTDPIDPEWRVFARAAADDKGPVMMFLAALDALRTEGRRPEINIKVLLDAEEEKGSPRLHLVMGEHRDLLRSDGLVVYDGVMQATNLPVVNFGNRGSVQLDLTVFGPASPQHSGHYGNVMPNPALHLAGLLAGMKNEQGRVTLPGYYDGVAINETDKALMARMATPAAALARRMGVARLESFAPNALEAVQYPSLDILGISSGQVGTGAAANAIPATATASLNIRTVPEAPPARQFDLVRQHVLRQGFHLIDGEAPTSQERSLHPKLARLTMTAYPSSATAARTEMTAPLARWVIQGVRAPRDVEPERFRMGGATLPMSGAVDVLKMSYVVVPLVNADNNQHGSDENMRLGNYIEGVRTIAAMLTTPMP